MFEKEAEEYTENPKSAWKQGMTCVGSVRQAFKDGAEFGYNKANEWHYVKDGDLPKETRNYLTYSEEWGVEIRKFFVDVDYFECRKDIVIAWKEIVLPKESE